MAIVILAKTIIEFTFQFLRGYSFHSNESCVQAVYTKSSFPFDYDFNHLYVYIWNTNKSNINNTH